MRRSDFIIKFLVSILFTVTVILYSANIAQAQNKNLRLTESFTIKSGPLVPQTFIIDVKNQQVISLEVKQNEMDVRIELNNPQATVVASADYPLSAPEIERIFLVAKKDGQYQMKTLSKFPG